MSKPVFVIGDAHGNHQLIIELMLKAGILERGVNGLSRTPSVKVVQIGDLCNCVGSSRDADLYCLQNARRWFDLVLVGNHEHPYFGGPHFSGFYPFPKIAEKLRALALQRFIRPTFRAGDILVTHAGVGPGWQFASAASAQATLTARWHMDPNGPLFSSIGHARGGWQSTGGVLWADASEPKEARFTQIVGHTPQPQIRCDSYGEHATWHIDLGGGKGRTRLGGIWIRDGVIAEAVVYDAAESEAA